MRRPVRHLMYLTVGGLVVLGMAACNAPSGHEKAVNNANARWRQMRSGLMMQMVRQQLETGDLDQAERTLRDALNIDPGNAQLQVLAGRVDLERGLLERAFNRFKAASELDEYLSDAPYYRGVVLERWQQYEAALTAYQQAFQLELDNPAHLLAISEMLVALERADEAFELLRSKLTYFDTSAPLRVAMARLCLLRHEYGEAADYFREASLLDSNREQTLEELGLAQRAAGRSDDAVETYERLCAEPKNRDRFELRRQLAGSYLDAGKLEKARDTYVALTKAQPNDAQIWVELGEVAWSMSDLSGATTAANRTMKLAPDRFEGYLLAGMVAQRQGHLEQALNYFARAAEQAPRNASPLVMRGLALQQAGRDHEAAAAYEQALRRQPTDVRAQMLLAAVSANSGS